MHRMNRLFLALAALIVFGLATSTIKADVCGTTAGNIVANCGFETGTFASWTNSGNTGFTGIDDGTAFGPPHSGTFHAFFGPVGSLGFLSQTLATTPGATYTLSYWLANLGGTPNLFGASFGGVLVPGSVLVDSAAFPYTLFTFSVVATGASSVLQFSFQHDPAFWLLDDVVVTPAGAAVPEPMTMLLLGSGLAGLGVKLRRRRKQQLARE